MKKTFTYNVPNELWVNDFSDGLTAAATYDGPETIDVLVDRDRVINWGSEIPENINKETQKVVTVDANQLPNVAYFITNAANLPEHEFEDETMPDGSIYKKVKNPSIFDYYQLFYVEGGVPSWRFDLITRETTTGAELKVSEDLSYVKRYANAYEFDSNTTSSINTYITKAEKYLKDMETVYPWKYIEITTPVAPKLPVTLINAFKDLPKV